MKRLRSITSQSPAIMIAICALIFSLGSGAYAAGLATGRANAARGVTAVSARARGLGPAAELAGVRWHKLRLLSGWTALGAGSYRAPSYAISGGVLYLSGILQAPAHGMEEPLVARLPEGTRPPHFLWLSFLNFGADDLGEMEVEPGGQIFVYSTAAGGRLVDPSLDGISFPLNS